MDTTMLKPGSSQALQQLIRRMFLEINTAVPGEIVAYNEEKQTATVKPCIRGTNIDNQGEVTYIDQPSIIEVPVWFPYSTSSGFAITYPINAGDQCLLIFSQRSFDNWLAKGSVQNPSEPGEPRSHQYSDAIAFVGLIPNSNAMKDFQMDGIEIRNLLRTTFVKLTDEKIDICAGANFVQIDKDGVVNIQAAGVLNVVGGTTTITGDVTIAGKLTVTNGYYTVYDDSIYEGKNGDQIDKPSFKNGLYIG